MIFFQKAPPILEATDWIGSVQKELEWLKGNKARWLNRYTLAAYKVIKAAGAEARGLKHGYVGAEHLLLGLLESSAGFATTVLFDAGLKYAAVQLEVVARVRTMGLFYEGMQISFTPRLRNICQSAERFAQARGCSLVEPEDLLLGLLDERSGMPSQVFQKAGLEIEPLRTRLLS